MAASLCAAPASAWEPRGITAEIDPIPRQATLLPPQIHANGALCGDPRVVGVPIAPIRGGVRGCGVAEPVQITGIAGVALSRPVNVDCPTARALRIWVDRAVKPAFAPLGGGVARLEIASGYHCRTRNNVSGAPISEHGRGRAIDVSGFRLKNGQVLSVLSGWRSKGESGLFRSIHGAACGPFGTVLGPQADRYHQDHFHLDTKRRLSGDYCR